MAKPGHDATQELSASQLVVPKPPTLPTSPAAPSPSSKPPVNDRSAWGQLVVGADDFAPVTRTPALRERRSLILAVGGVLAIVAGIAVYSMMPGSPPAPAASEPVTPGPVASPPPPKDIVQPAAVVAPADAALAEVAPDASADTPTDTTNRIDATADAISGTAPPIKEVAKPAVTKKKPKVVKKPAIRKPAITKKKPR